MIRWHNLDLLNKCQSVEELVNLICGSIPQDAKIIRVHVSGDFYKENYFVAWMLVAAMFPNITFYAYTKSIPTYLKFRNLVPANFRITASMGSKHDDLILANNLNRSVVVKSEAEAAALGLEIDDDDSHAQAGDSSFALLVHAAQPAGTVWAEAWEALRQATVKENKSKGPKRVAPEVTTAQWIARILKMVSRLWVAGGSLNQEDAALVGRLYIEAGVPSPAIAA